MQPKSHNIQKNSVSVSILSTAGEDIGPNAPIDESNLEVLL